MVHVVPCSPASLCPVPLAARTAHVSASGWWVACGQGASSAGSAAYEEAAGGAWVSGPGLAAAPLRASASMVVGGPGWAVPVGSPA